MQYCFNNFFYLHMASNYRPNGLVLQAHFVKFWVGPSWHETAILPKPIALLFPFPYLALVSLLSEHGSLVMEGNT